MPPHTEFKEAGQVVLEELSSELSDYKSEALSVKSVLEIQDYVTEPWGKASACRMIQGVQELACCCLIR